MKKEKKDKNYHKNYLKRIRAGPKNKSIIKIKSFFVSFPLQEIYFQWYNDEKEMWKETKTTLN